MNTTFQDFLRHKAEAYEATARTALPMIAEWKVSVETLFRQLREWLKVSDPNGLIQIEESTETIKEPGLGEYNIPRLDIRVFGRWIGVIPKARKTVGTAQPPHTKSPERAIGRVDITDELRRYVLYRFREGDRDVWMIDGTPERSWPGEALFVQTPQQLTRESFERALMSYLQ